MKILIMLLAAITIAMAPSAQSKTLSCSSIWSIEPQGRQPWDDSPVEGGALQVVKALGKGDQPLKFQQADAWTTLIQLSDSYTFLSYIVLTSKAGIVFDLYHNGSNDNLDVTAKSKRITAHSEGIGRASLGLEDNGVSSSIDCKVLK